MTGIITAHADASHRATAERTAPARPVPCKREPHITRLSRCALLAGSIASVRHAVSELDPQHAWGAIMHTFPLGDDAQAASAGARSRLLRSFLIVDAAQPLPVGESAPAVAAAVPGDRLTDLLVAPVVQLRQTPLVRASRSLLLSLVAELSSPPATGSRGVDDVLTSLFRATVAEHTRSETLHDPAATPEAQLVAVIEARHSDPTLGVDQIARELHFSRRQLYRHCGGEGVAAMLTERRIATARELLRTRPEMSITQVAQQSGFATAARMRTHFLRRLGVTPTQYRRVTPLAS